jgi:membrane-associated phospholipid phosphatase
MKMKDWLYQHRFGWVIGYVTIYLLWFGALEMRTDREWNVIHLALDDYIPFEEIFVIPYLLWFFYVAVTVVYFMFTSKEDFVHLTLFLFSGMTICLIIYTVWPSVQNLRPVQFPRDNVLTDIVKYLYAADTSTNVCPSIHVFNSIGVHIAICKSKQFRNKKWVTAGSFGLMVSICLATLFLKQHSVFDGICAVVLSVFMYLIVYKVDYENMKQNGRLRRKGEKGVVRTGF